jgi:hypothetical protein
MKLGCQPPRRDMRTLRLANYLTAELPPIPTARKWSADTTATWGMMQNDRLGDCTCAGAGHAIQTWTAAAGAEVTITDSAVVAAYEAVSGYDPAYPETDNGAVMLDVLNYWRKNGIGGHRIGAFMAVNPLNQAHVRAAIELFGGIYVGARLPLSAQEQAIWDVPEAGSVGRGAPGSWGGHCIFTPDFDPDGFNCVTWGALKRMTSDWWITYVSEAWAIISADFLVDGKSPNGFDLPALQADLELVCR